MNHKSDTFVCYRNLKDFPRTVSPIYSRKVITQDGHKCSERRCWGFLKSCKQQTRLRVVVNTTHQQPANFWPWSLSKMDLGSFGKSSCAKTTSIYWEQQVIFKGTENVIASDHIFNWYTRIWKSCRGNPSPVWFLKMNISMIVARVSSREHLTGQSNWSSRRGVGLVAVIWNGTTVNADLDAAIKC